MRIYFTYVMPYYTGGWHTLDEHFRKNFGSLNFRYNTYLAKSQDGSDGRVLAFIETDDTDKASSILNAVLRTFIHTIETPEQAKDKILRWIGLDSVIKGDIVEICIPDNPLMNLIADSSNKPV